MKNNDAYMIPSYDVCDGEVATGTEKECLTAKRLYRKQWRAAVHKQQEKATVQTLPMDTHVAWKIDAATTRITGRFSDAGSFLKVEILQMQREGTAEKRDMLCAATERYIDALWMNCAKDYAQLCVFNYLEGARLVAFPKANTKSADSIDGYEDLLAELVIASAEQYVQQRNDFKEKIANIVEEENVVIDELPEEMERAYSTGWKRILDGMHRQKVQGSLDGIRLSGRTKYTYICNNTDNSCNNCAILDGQVFDISAAEEGVNLPPIHPNCRCTVNGYPALSGTEAVSDFLEALREISFAVTANQTGGRIRRAFNGALEALGLVWSEFFEQSIQDYYGTFTTIEIDGTEYRINRNNFTAVAVGPDGKLIVPENAKPYDEQMLALMKMRDSLPEGSAKRAEIEQEIKKLEKESENRGEELLSVKSEKLYTFYMLGEDVTERLNKYMRQTEVDYADMHKRYWVENLMAFYQLVRGGGEMDLKAQPEWQHSAYVYDGELVSQDALGNINYGYFGAFCNIPKLVLIFAGGFAQWRSSRNAELDFWYTFFDDPRDTYRVLQGIEICNLWH